MPTIPDLRSMAWQTAKTDLEIVHQIQDGKEPVMPPFRGKLSQQQILGLAIYLRAFAIDTTAAAAKNPSQAVPPLPITSEAQQAVPPKETLPPQLAQKQTPPVKGAEVSGVSPPSETTQRVHFAAAAYRQNCLTCHGSNGRGTDMRPTMPAIPDFTNRGWQRNRSNAQLAASVHDGKNGLMPAFGDRLTPNDIRDLVVYVRAFGPPVPAPAAPRVDEFDRQFQELQEQWNQLEHQIKELPPEPDKP
jgi:mono/diheme cytochrome c family protein